jgi:hypothetical protein
MARYKPIDMSPKLIPVDFCRQLLPGSFAYALCHLLDHEMELSEFDHRCRNDEGGTPAYAPALLLKILLLAYSRGLVSSRAIESACRHHVLFMAVSGGVTPHFTTLAAFVSTGGEALWSTTLRSWRTWGMRGECRNRETRAREGEEHAAMPAWLPLPHGRHDGYGNAGLSCARAQSSAPAYGQVKRGFSTTSLGGLHDRRMKWEFVGGVE